MGNQSRLSITSTVLSYFSVSPVVPIYQLLQCVVVKSQLSLLLYQLALVMCPVWSPVHLQSLRSSKKRNQLSLHLPATQAREERESPQVPFLRRLSYWTRSHLFKSLIRCLVHLLARAEKRDMEKGQKTRTIITQPINQLMAIRQIIITSLLHTTSQATITATTLATSTMVTILTTI